MSHWCNGVAHYQNITLEERQSMTGVIDKYRTLIDDIYAIQGEYLYTLHWL
jgi:hypothetical protein